MALPAPNLDDRHFQDLVDDAKRMVQQRCPEWTDHNVSDPGVTLIELFAWMTDLTLYRLNRVPDRNYVRFLELLGVQLYPATAARAGITFWLAGEIDQLVTVPEGVEVATAVSDVEDAVRFSTVDELTMPPCSLVAIKTRSGGGSAIDHGELLQGGRGFAAFSEVPEQDDHLLFGLSDALPSCAVEFDVDCRIEGVGVDPEDPPLVWEAWDGERWVGCDLDRDTTGGLNQRGKVVVHLPSDHTSSIIDQDRAGWVRCRVVEAYEGQPAYRASPQIDAAQARTVGGTAPAVHGREVEGEIVGVSEGVPGQRFDLTHTPVLGGEGPMRVEVSTAAGWQVWDEVTSFAGCGPDDRVFVLDAVAGEITFGPSIREADGTLRHYGAVPPKGAPIRVPSYRVGGGRAGNVAAGTVTQLLTAIPFVDRVSNRRPAAGGVDVESMDNARQRGPIELSTRDRAVTAEDYEHLAKQAAPEVARIRCVPVTSGEDAGAARLLVVPAVSTAGGQLPFEELVPSDETLARIAEHLEDRRTLGARLVVEPALYQGVTIVARLRAKPTANLQRLERAATEALHRYFHPIVGGPDGQGWPFGRPIHVGEVYAVLQGVDATEFVEDARLFAADPISGSRGEATDRIDLEPTALAFSYEHRLRVEPSLSMAAGQ